MSKNRIIVLHNEGLSNREIAKKLKISKDTVNKYVNQANDILKMLENEVDRTRIIELQEKLVSAPIRKNVSVRKIFNGQLKARFYELIKFDEEKNLKLGPNKQKLTASLIYRTLINEGFVVGITTIQQEFNRYRSKNKECFIKQVYEPGERAEYDFHEIKVLIAGRIRKINQATITLPSSNTIYTTYYEDQKQENFIDSLVSFFEYIGGVTKNIVFDNMRNVVSRFIYRGDKIYNEELIKLSNYYGFKIVTTNPRKGNEKGHVENSGKTARNELFTLNYEFESLAALRLYSREKIEKINKSNQERYKNEQIYLKKLPKVRYELGRPVKSKVDHSALISIDQNFYSVPDCYIGHLVYANVYIDYINIYNDKHENIASHIKKAGKEEYAINILHFTQTFMRKPGALANSLALKQAPKVYQTLFHKYFTTKVRAYINLINKLNIYEITEMMSDLDSKKILITDYQKSTNSIEDVSLNQLNEISSLYNQGVIKS